MKRLKHQTKHQEEKREPEQTEQMPSDLQDTALEAQEDLSARLLEAETKRDEYLDMAQRVQAEFDNFRRRNQQVRSEAYEDGARAFIKTVLPVVDNLERALTAETSDAAMLEGVQLVCKQLLETLEKRGVTVIDRKGERFDPNLEDAVVQGDASEGEPGTVSQVLLKGYKMGDHVLRHAMVKVIAE